MRPSGVALLAILAPAWALVQPGAEDGRPEMLLSTETSMYSSPDVDEDNKALTLVRSMFWAQNGVRTSRASGGVQADCSVQQCLFFNQSGSCNAFVNENACNNLRKGRTWLASYPGSGNTWTRVMLQAITGVYTGSMYDDARLKEEGLLGEGHRDPHEVFTIKTHLPVVPGRDPHATVPRLFGRAIVITRHPLKAMLSWTSLRLGKGDHGLEQPRAKVRHFFTSFRPMFMSLWVNHSTYWSDVFKGKRLFVKYEDIKKHTLKTYFERILPFLHVDVKRQSIVDVVKCALDKSNAEHATHRGHSYEFHFSEEDYDHITPHTSLIKSLGYDLQPED